MRYVLWNISATCNLACRYCWSRAGDDAGRELGCNDKLELIHRLDSLGCKTIVLTGGEPLLAEGFWDVLEYCSRSRISSRVLTNGTLLDQAAVRELTLLGVEEVHVSLDSLDPEENDIYRGCGDEALRALSLLTRTSSGRTKIVVSAVAMAQRLDQLRRILARAEESAFTVQYQMCCVGVGHPVWSEDPRSLDMRRRLHWLKQLRLLHIDHGRRLLPSARAYFHHAYRWLVDASIPTLPCPAGQEAMVVSPTGRLTPCFFRDERGADIAQCFDLECALFFRGRV